jgi:hypothetical protein
LSNERLHIASRVVVAFAWAVVIVGIATLFTPRRWLDGPELTRVVSRIGSDRPPTQLEFEDALKASMRRKHTIEFASSILLAPFTYVVIFGRRSSRR